MSAPTAQVPGELMEELHVATERFHEHRVKLENVMDGSEYRHGERLAAATDELHKAECALEDLDEKIGRAMAENRRG